MKGTTKWHVLVFYITAKSDNPACDIQVTNVITTTFNTSNDSTIIANEGIQMWLLSNKLNGRAAVANTHSIMGLSL